MDNSEEAVSTDCEMPQQSLPLENNLSLTNDIIDPLKSMDQNRNSENQTSIGTTDNSSQNVTVAPETSSAVPSSDNSMPPLPPLPKDDKELPQPPVPYSADYSMQNYANYNYMYNYNNYYGYPYPQYQWDYNSQQYYQPYQNYYNYNYNTSPTQTSKPPPPPLDAVQLPVEEKPANKANATTVEDSNRYSPTAEPDDDDNLKGGLLENNKSDVCVKPSSTCPTLQTTTSLTNSVPLQNVSSIQIENPQNISTSIENKIQQPIVPLIIPVQQPIVPVIAAQLPAYNIPVQQPNYPINLQVKTQPTEAVNELTTPQQNSPILNGKDDSVEKLSKTVTVLGKNQAKKRLMAFSMMKQKLQEQNNSINDNQGSDVCEGNDVEFIPELNVFQTVTKKKVVTNKKVIKVIKAQQTIEQIEEMKKDELLQGNNAALYQHLLRSSGNEAPILQKLGIESLAEKYSAKIREQDKRLKRHHHRHRDDRRSHKHRRRSRSKSRSRSRSRSKSAEKPKMRALEVKSWRDFVDGGFNFDKFRRFKLNETEEMKVKERKSRSKKKHRDSRSDGKNQNTESIISTKTEKESEQNLRYNLLDRKKEILKGLEVVTQEGGDCTKDFPSYLIQHTKSKPVVKYSQNPAKATYHFHNRQQMLATLLPEVEAIVHKFLSSMKPKRLKENPIENYNYVDDKLLLIMKDKNIYPFKGWWPKKSFIITQVKEDPNIEIDNNALINEFTTNKRTKKSRFNDDPLVDLRPTVPSKWDSDYDGSPAADKLMDVEVSQNVEMNTDDVCIIDREESNLPDISHQEVARDISEEETKTDVNICPIVPTPFQKPQAPAKLATEYEEFLKIVSVEKSDEEDENAISITDIQKENESNLSVNLVSLNNESIHDKDSENDDMSTKSSDESISLHNTAEESIDRSYVKSSSSIEKKCKKKKKPSSKKSKKIKKKESRKKKYKSSSSESSEDSETDESDSSSEDESESTDSCSSVEKKKKKKKLKGRKKKKSKANYKKNYKGNKNKNKKLEDDKDSNSSILNLLEKAFNVEIKKRPIESEESKKKKRKHVKKEKKYAVDNDDEFEKVKECLKETFTKLVNTDKVKRNQSLSCDDTTVSEVLKYLKIDKEKLKKNKKSKKNSKRKYDSDNSDDEKSIKRSRLDDSLKLDDSEKKKKKKKKSSRKKSVDSDEYVLKEKSKKKSKTPETSDTEDEDESNYKTPNKEKDSKNFFGQRPNEWNMINKSSMRGVVHHSADQNINYTFTDNISGVDDDNIKKSKFNSLKLNSKISCSPDTDDNIIDQKPMLLSDILKNHTRKKNKSEKSEMCDEYVKIFKDDKLKHIVEEKVQINFKNSDNASGKKKIYNFEDSVMFDKFDQFDNNEVEHKSDVVPQSTITKNDFKRQDLNNDVNNVVNSTLNKSFKLNDTYVTTIIKPIVSVQESISYRDKVKMNLKKLSAFQDTPFLFGFSSPLNVIKSCSLKKEIIKDFQLLDEENKSPEEDESKLLKFAERPKIVICPQTQKKQPNATQIASPKIDMETTNEILDQSFNSDNSDKSYSDNSSVDSINAMDHSSDEENNEQVNSGLLEECLSSIQDENQKYKNELFSNNSNLENNEKDVSWKVESIFDDKEITTFSNSADLNKSEHFESSTAMSHDNESIKIISSEKKDSDSICSQQSSIDLDVTEIELISQWISDWSVLDMSVRENNNKMDESNAFEVNNTSHWDKQSKNNITNESQRVFNGQEFEDETSNCSIDEINTTSAQSDLDIFLERQSQQDALTSLNNLDDGTEYDYYTENWSNEYKKYSQSYDQQYYCGPPQYSEMKTLECDQLSPVDYSVYENYNPDYDCHNENLVNWKSIDTSNQLVTDGLSSSQFATDDEMSMPLQVGNVLKILPSDNIVTIVPDDQDEELNSERRSEQFFHLYQQYFQHYNQNPIKYSMSDPVLSNTTNVNIGIPDKLVPQENLDGNAENKIVLIPLQDRAYAHILEDDNNILYMTNDNYIAYCAIEDKCMVHIALDPVNRDGIDDKVRHCFNIYQNGPVIEYWLNADLIPFNSSSDSESGVFSDEEAYSETSNSDDDDEEDDGGSGGMDNNNEDDVNDNVIEGEWELMESDGEDKDAWLNDPHVFEKYREVIDGVEHTMTEINEDDESNSSSEYDTDASDYFDSSVETSPSKKQNVTVNSYQMPFARNEDNKNNFQNIVDVNTPIDGVKQTENISKNLDLSMEVVDNVTLSEQLVLNAETEQVNDTLEEVYKDTTSKINTGFDDNISREFEEKENNNGKEQGILLKDGITVEDLTMMNTIINQQLLIQRLKIRAKNKIQNKLPDTLLVCYSDNMESVKHPFLGLFQPPTISILSKNQDTKTNKRVTFADGICPGDHLAASPTHDEVGRPLSPPPLKALMRETLKLKRNLYPFKKSKKRVRHIKLTMTNKKVAMVNPTIKSADSSSSIRYYIDKRCRSDDVVQTVVNNNAVISDDSSSDNISPSGPIDTTPVPSDNESWNDDENARNTDTFNLDPE